MSTSSHVGGRLHYEQPSCMKETLMSGWIWIREQVDVEIRNHTTAIIAESNLLSVRDNIEKNKLKTGNEQDVLMRELRTKARACKSGPKEFRVGNLKKLLPLLERCKRYRQQTALAGQQLSLLDMQINAFENGRFQKEMTDTLRASVVAMKQVGITDDASDVDTIVIDMEETMAAQNQVSESLASTFVNSAEDTSDDSLMHELMALMGDDEEVMDEPMNATSPTAAVPQSVVLLPPTPISVMQETDAAEQDVERTTQQDGLASLV
ncbi:hypothetical protein T484DRAFT_1755033 [Baffinella frigidus]|nr:hypothetical protein T484DRAFT_1755033 [Cryptophyta sp. CCMP2293]